MVPKVGFKADLSLKIPEEYLKRRSLSSDTEFFLSERNGDLILHPIKRDVRKLYIEPTTKCNLKCLFCIRNIWGDPLEHMSLQTFEKIRESIPDLPNLDQVVFGGFGEPLSHPRILEMIESMREFGLKVSLSTNGVLLTPGIAKELIRLGVERIIISIDGSPETYLRIRGSILSKVLENIENLNKAKLETGSPYPVLEIEFVVLKSNLKELAGIVDIAPKLGVSTVIVSNVLAYTEDMVAERLYTYEPQPPIKASGGWPLRMDVWLQHGTLKLPRLFLSAERRCRFVSDNSVVIAWDGGISPCYALSHSYSYFTLDGRKKFVSRYLLGNINEKPLGEIWTSKEYVIFRSVVKAFYFPSCYSCDLRQTCDLREQNQGCWGWNPSCADCLWAQDIIICP